MKNDLFEKAKQAVAVENGYSDWGQVLRICDYEDVYRMMEEVFEYGCNEAVKADRAEAANKIKMTPGVGLSNQDIVTNRPLPFPQQPDEISVKERRTCIKCGKNLPEEEFYEAYNATGSIRTDCKKCNIATALLREKRLRETDPVWLEKERKRQIEKVKRYRQSKKKS